VAAVMTPNLVQLPCAGAISRLPKATYPLIGKPPLSQRRQCRFSVIQHEYGIYGGRAGSLCLELLKHLTMPVVTTLHTVFASRT